MPLAYMPLLAIYAQQDDGAHPRLLTLTPSPAPYGFWTDLARRLGRDTIMPNNQIAIKFKANAVIEAAHAADPATSASADWLAKTAARLDAKPYDAKNSTLYVAPEDLLDPTDIPAGGPSKDALIIRTIMIASKNSHVVPGVAMLADSNEIEAFLAVVRAKHPDFTNIGETGESQPLPFMPEKMTDLDRKASTINDVAVSAEIFQLFQAIAYIYELNPFTTVYVERRKVALKAQSRYSPAIKAIEEKKRESQCAAKDSHGVKKK